MIVYFAGIDKAGGDLDKAIKAGARHFLLTYYYHGDHKPIMRRIRRAGCHAFLDCGAFSAWKKGEEISLEAYTKYIRQAGIGKYMSLDIVGDPEQSLFYFQAMQDNGLFPVPVYHIGDPVEYLDYYVNSSQLIALGGTVGKPKGERREFFSSCFERWPAQPFHGLGLNDIDLINMFPWDSVDATTWIHGRKSGRILTEAGQKTTSLPAEEVLNRNIHFMTSKSIEGVKSL